MKLDLKKYSVRVIIFFVIILSNVACDQISKEVVRSNVQEHVVSEVMGSFFIMYRVENTGAFLSMGDDWPAWANVTFLKVLPILMLLAGIFYVVKVVGKMTMSNILAFSFIIGGGLGNLIDRILYASVTDFFLMDFGFARTGVFNMADVAICVGFGIVVVFGFKDKKSKGNKKLADKSEPENSEKELKVTEG